MELSGLVNMNRLAWDYIEPTPIGNSGLVASNIQNAQASMNTGLAGLKQLSNDIQLEQAAQQEAERLRLLGGLSQKVSDTNINLDTYVMPTNMKGLANQTTSNPDFTSFGNGLATPTVTPKVESGSGLARASVERAKPYMGIVQAASKAYGVPEDVILAVIETESGFKPDAKSATGVRGIMQVTQSTYDGLGFKGDRSDPTNSINAGTKLLSQLYRQYGNWDDAFSAYNGGADAVRGLHTGNWGVWSDNLNKQKEISNYAHKVNNYRTAWNS